MSIEEKTVETAQNYADRSEEDLLMLLARQEVVIKSDPAKAEDPTLDPSYESAGMPAEALRAIGKKIMRRWNQSLFELICKQKDDKNRQKLIEAAGIGETALIGAVASVLLTLTSPAIAAAAAAIIVKHFLVPAGGVVCDAWEEAIALDG
ncbi:hypothetical protein [Yoonia sp. SS1-5]|uniref:Uncharacterized protein n=1 Tax=Yoonia rhodophyticola TaxID=3137370 RepID=A0AAN0MCR3_9RHOB